MMACRCAIPVLLSLGLAVSGSAHAGCESEEYRLFDKLLGVWEEYEILEEGREHLGTLTTELAAGGCALTQSFVSPDESFSFVSLGFLDAEGTWNERYVLSTGRVASYTWAEREDALVLDRASAGSGPMRRLVIFDIEADSYFVADEESVDGGRTWKRRELVHTLRRGSEAR